MLAYNVALFNANFGIDPIAVLDSLGLKDTLFSTFKLSSDTKLEDWHTSAIIAVLAADSLELLRVPATFFLAPRVKKWWDAKRLLDKISATHPR